MSGPQVQLTGGAVLVGLGLLVGGVLAYKAYKAGAGLLGDAGQAIGQAYDQAAASVQSTWENSFAGPFQQGQDYMAGVAPVTSSRAWLYSDYAYTGIDPATAQLVSAGQWLASEEARRYSAEQAARGTTPAAQSNSGAAFGIYPR